MTTGRVAHSVVNWNNQIWALGGDSESVSRTTEYLNTQTGQWKTGPTMLYSRTLAAAVVIGNYIYICGGNYNLTSCEKLELKEDENFGSWLQVADMPHGRARFQMVAWNGTLLAIGGTGRGSSVFVNVIDQYLPDLDKWVPFSTDVSTDMGYFAAVLIDIPDKSMKC